MEGLEKLAKTRGSYGYNALKYRDAAIPIGASVGSILTSLGAGNIARRRFNSRKINDLLDNGLLPPELYKKQKDKLLRSAKRWRIGSRTAAIASIPLAAYGLYRLYEIRKKEHK